MVGQLHPLDYCLIAAYLAGTLALGLWISRRVHTGTDFFLAGRSLPWWAIGFSLVATDIGGTDIIGVGGAAYTYGMSVGNFEWIGCVPAMILAAFIFIPFFWRSGVYTIPEFMERRYNASVRSALAFCWIVFMACNLGIMLYASAKMITTVVGFDLRGTAVFGWQLGGQEVLISILLTAAFVGVYTFAGGLAAVVYTDMIQCVVMIGGCLLVVVLGLIDLGGIGGMTRRIHERERIAPYETTLGMQREALAILEGAVDEHTAVTADVVERNASDMPSSDALSVLVRENYRLIESYEERIESLAPGERERVRDAQAAAEQLDDADPSVVGEHTSLILPVDTAGPFPWTGIFFGLALILSPAYWIGNQAIVQRSFGARSEFDAKAAYVCGALLKNVIPIVVAIPGLIAYAKYDLADGDVAFPSLVSGILPIGLRGIFLAAFLAALMSSVDSYLNSAATLLTNDLYKRFLHPNSTDEHLLRVGRMTTVILVVWGIVFALVISGMKEGIYAIFQTLMAFFQGPALAILLAGVFWRRATGTGALAGFLGGIATSITLFTLNHETVYNWLGWPPLFRIREPFLYFSIWAFLVATALIVVVSLATKPEPEEKVHSLIYHFRRSPAS